MTIHPDVVLPQDFSIISPSDVIFVKKNTYTLPSEQVMRILKLIR